MKTFFDQVGDFHERFDLPRHGDGNPPKLLDPNVFKFRYGFIEEELKEFDHAISTNDLEAAADALVDLTYVVLGTAHMMHLPFNECWAEVQRANMTKVRASGADDPRSKRAHHFDVVKPHDFVPPDHRPILEAAGAQLELPL